MDWLFPLAGLMVGILVGMTGVGGGALMTPLLILGFNVPPIIAIGTDLLFAAATKTVGTITHGWQGTVQWRMVALLALGSLPATLLTLQYLAALQTNIETMDSIVRSTLGVVLFLTAVLLICRQRLISLVNSCITRRDSNRQNNNSQDSNIIALLTVLAGVVLGFIVTLTSVGAGAIGIVILSLLYPRLETAKIVGTDIAHAVPLTLVAGIGHFQLGSVDTQLLLWLLLGSIPGVYIGSRMSRLMPEKYLRVVLASILFGVSYQLMT